MWRAALVALCVAALGASASGEAAPTGGARTAANPLVAIHFEFKSAEFATHYTVVNTLDPAGLLDLADASYRWTLKPPDDDATCNNHGVLSSQEKEFVWKHGNVGEPGHDDGCHHDVGLPSSGHPGTITVQVRDSRWSCVAAYTGTQAADGSAIGEGPAGNCDALNAPPPLPPPPPPPPPKCKCLLLTARVVPSSLKLEAFQNYSQGFGKWDSGRRDFTFTVHWVLNCATGKGGCNGHLSVKEPASTDRRSFHWEKTPPRDPDIIPVSCPGACGKLRDGGQTMTLVGFERQAHPNDHADLWKSAGFKFLIKRTCQKRKLSSVTIWIMLDKAGTKIDFKKSKLR
jgi:hypothetical protein